MLKGVSMIEYNHKEQEDLKDATEDLKDATEDLKTCEQEDLKDATEDLKTCEQEDLKSRNTLTNVFNA